MTTPTELAATEYWNSLHVLRSDRLNQKRFADALEKLYQLANSGPPRVRAIVARRLKPVIVADDGGTVA